MKNIILLGVPRAGKSTFAKMILNKFPNYNLIEGDTIANAYLCTLKETSNNNVITYDTNFSKKLIKQIFINSSECEPTLNYILDTSFLDLDDIKDLDYKNNLIIVFGYPNITVEEEILNLLKYDTENDWTYREPEWKKRNYIDYYIKSSKHYEEECKKLNLKFIDTSKNRQETLNELLTWIK